MHYMLEITKRKGGVLLHTNVRTMVPVLVTVTVHIRAQKRDSLTINFTVTNRSVKQEEAGTHISDVRASIYDYCRE